MHRFIAVLGIAVLMTASAQSKPQQPAFDSFAVEHVTVINVANGSRSADQTVVVSGNRVASAGPAAGARVPAGVRVLDGRGKFLIPGLWDMHVHTLYSIPARTLPYFAARGMTGVRDMGGGLDKLSEARQLIENGIVAPRLISPGPLLIGAPIRPDFTPGTGLIVKSPAEGRQAVNRLLAQRVDFIKMQTNLPKETAVAIADEARRWKARFVGHLPLDMNIVEASDLGFHSIEHIVALAPLCAANSEDLQPADPNAPSPSGPIAIDRAKCQQAVQHLARNGTWFCPMISAFATAIPRTRTFNLAILQMAIRAGVKILAGTDAPGYMFWKGDYAIAGRSVQDELAGLVEAGMTPLQALQAATVNPAAFLEMSSQLGSVEAGKLADLVLLDADPLLDIANTRRISAVVLNGRLIDAVQRQKLIDDELATQKATTRSN